MGETFELLETGMLAARFPERPSNDDEEWVQFLFSENDLKISFGGDGLDDSPLFILDRDQILSLASIFAVAADIHKAEAAARLASRPTYKPVLWKDLYPDS